MDRILIAVDFSEGSRRALRTAMELSRAFQASLRVVHVLSPGLYSGLESVASAAYKPVEAQEVEKLLHDFVVANFKGGNEEFERIERKVLIGSGASKILEDALWWDASLIVVGGQGHSAVHHLVLGSVSSRVLSRASVPVLVVRSEVGRPRKVLAAIDRTPVGADVLKVASTWANRLQATLSVVHVMPGLPEPILARVFPPSTPSPDLTDLMKQIEQEVEICVGKALPDDQPPAIHCRVGKAAEEVCKCAEEGEFDLVVLGTHERKRPLDLSNTTARVAQQCSCSVLVARLSEAPEDMEESVRRELHV